MITCYLPIEARSGVHEIAEFINGHVRWSRVHKHEKPVHLHMNIRNICLNGESDLGEVWIDTQDRDIVLTYCFLQFVHFFSTSFEYLNNGKQ